MRRSPPLRGAAWWLRRFEVNWSWRSALLVDPLIAGELDKVIGMPAETQAFLGTEPQKALSAERVFEEPDHPILQFAIEVDQHITATDQLHLGEDLVGDQTVIRKDGSPAQALVERGRAIGRGVIIRQGRF